MGVKLLLVLFFITASLKLSSQARESFINIEVGPALFHENKHNYYLISNGIGYSAEANIDFWMDKRFAINTGLGINKYFREFTPPFDTSFQYIPSFNACNCGFYTSNQKIFQLFIPFQVKYLFLKHDKVELALTAGVQITYTTRDVMFSSSYIRLSNGVFDPGPYYYRFEEAYRMNEEFPLLNKYAFGLIMYNKISVNLLFFTNVSYVFPLYFKLIKLEAGLALTKKQKRFHHWHSHG